MGLKKSSPDLSEKISSVFSGVPSKIPSELAPYTLRLPRNFMDKLMDEAKRRGLKRADLVRQAIFEFIEKEDL